MGTDDLWPGTWLKNIKDGQAEKQSLEYRGKSDWNRLINVVFWNIKCGFIFWASFQYFYFFQPVETKWKFRNIGSSFINAADLISSHTYRAAYIPRHTLLSQKFPIDRFTLQQLFLQIAGRLLCAAFCVKVAPLCHVPVYCLFDVLKLCQPVCVILLC